MANEDGSIWVVFNGEIYNFASVRRELKEKGHTFRSATDTEVLVHLYEEYGDRMGERLEGMFAFAVWDDRRKRLLLMRDRLGIKPLYYREDCNGLTFASELRALATGDTLDDASINAYLRLGWVPAATTVLSGIRTLPPGHLLTWEAGQSATRRWWAPRSGQHAPLGEVLRQAVRRQLVADVPVGLFLSSGVDSVVIAALAAEVAPDVETYTVGFDVGEDETGAASAISDRLGLRHHVVNLGSSEVIASLPSIIGSMDQPTVDGVNSWVISKAVRDAGVVVALSGLGGDELFCGYSTFRHVPRLASVPPLGRRLLRVASPRVGGRLGRAMEAAATGGYAQAYAAVRGLFNNEDVARLRPGRPAGPVPVPMIVEPWPQWGGKAGLVTQLELANYLPDQLLRDTDSMSMAHSLEVRVPLLDDAVVAAVLALQVSGKAPTKRDLIDAVDPGLQAVLAGPKKTFTLPFAEWMRGPMRGSVLDGLAWLGDAPLGFDRRALTAAWLRYEAAGESWRPVWALAVLAWWAQDQHRRGRLRLDG